MLWDLMASIIIVSIFRDRVVWIKLSRFYFQFRSNLDRWGFNG